MTWMLWVSSGRVYAIFGHFSASTYHLRPASAFISESTDIFTPYDILIPRICVSIRYTC